MSLPYLVQTFETVQTSLHIRIKLNRESMYLVFIKGTGSPDFFFASFTKGNNFVISCALGFQNGFYS